MPATTPESTLLSTEHAIRVIARPDSQLDWSGGAADVSYIEITDLRTDRRVESGNVRQTGLIPTDVLSSRAALFVDDEGQPWMWTSGSLRLKGITNVERLRARYRPQLPVSTAPGLADATLSGIWFDCPVCGGGERFTGRVQRGDAGRWEAIVHCFRCDEERTRRDSRTEPVIDAYANAFDALADRDGFLDTLQQLRDGSPAERHALLHADDRTLPLLSANDARCGGDLLPAWTARMLDGSGWLPKPTMTCRLEEILVAAVEGRHTGCVDMVLAAAGRYTADEMTGALARVAVRCGDVGVYGTDSVIARVVAA